MAILFGSRREGTTVGPNCRVMKGDEAGATSLAPRFISASCVLSTRRKRRKGTGLKTRHYADEEARWGTRGSGVRGRLRVLPLETGGATRMLVLCAARILAGTSRSPHTK